MIRMPLLALESKHDSNNIKTFVIIQVTWCVVRSPCVLFNVKPLLHRCSSLKSFNVSKLIFVIAGSFVLDDTTKMKTKSSIPHQNAF